MITKELIKAEIENVNDSYLEVLYKIIKIFKAPIDFNFSAANNGNNVVRKDEALDWKAFIAQTYGCLAENQIERGVQGNYEVREAL